MSHRARRDIGPVIYQRMVDRLEQHGMTIHAFCKRIKLDRSIPARWKTGTTPSLVTYLLVFDELDQMDMDALPDVGL